MDENLKTNGKVQLKVINLKIESESKKRFKTNAKLNGGTMQSVLAAFVESYNEDPRKFKLKLEIAE